MCNAGVRVILVALVASIMLGDATAAPIKPGKQTTPGRINLRTMKLVPKVKLTATPQEGDPGQSVLFDGSGSIPAKGTTITKHEWDFGADGIYDADTGTTPSISGPLPNEPGEIPVVLRVTESDGGSATAMIFVTTKGWAKASPAPAPNGSHCSLAQIKGRAALAYYDQLSGHLFFVRAAELSPSGAKWTAPVLIDNSDNAGQYCSLATVGGFPAISYYESSSGNLKFVRATDAEGLSWSQPFTVDSAGNVGLHTSLTQSGSSAVPLISYYDADAKNLKVAVGESVLGNIWKPTVVLDSPGEVGEFSSCATLDGKVGNNGVGICYFDSTNGDLKYIYGDHWGALISWEAPMIIDSGDSVGRYASLCEVNGRPSVCYRNGNGGVRYLRANDSTGDSWGSPLPIETSGGACCAISLCATSTYPALSYRDEVSGALNFATATNASGSNWQPAVAVDGMAGAGTFSSISRIGNRPGIAYSTAAGISYIKLY